MRRLPLLLILLAWFVPNGPASEKGSFRLAGTVLGDDGKPLRRVIPVVFLNGALTPFASQTQAGRDGKFTFKNLSAGTYTLGVYVPRAGEVQKTIEVGPSFADSKRTIRFTVKFDRADVLEKDHSVSAVQLSVPQGAREELSRAENYLSRRDVKGAIECLEKAVRMAPQFAEAWNRLGTIAYLSARYQQAEEYFREALKQDPEEYSPLVNLGGALLSEGKFKESLSVNERAVQLRPGDALAHSQLGQSYFQLGELDQAEKHLKQAIALDPNHFSFPQLFLVGIYVRRRQFDAAVAEINQFLKLHPDSKQAPQMRKALEEVRSQSAPKS